MNINIQKNCYKACDKATKDNGLCGCINNFKYLFSDGDGDVCKKFIHQMDFTIDSCQNCGNKRNKHQNTKQ